jgi:hypothetical protein
VEIVDLNKKIVELEKQAAELESYRRIAAALTMFPGASIHGCDYGRTANGIVMSGVGVTSIDADQQLYREVETNLGTVKVYAPVRIDTSAAAAVIDEPRFAGMSHKQAMLAALLETGRPLLP